MRPLVGKKIWWWAVAACGTSYVTFGYDAGVLGGIIVTPEFQSAVGYPNTNTISMITSIFSLGSLVGCLITSWLGPRWGRRTWILVGNAINVVGTIISTASFSSGQLIAGRIVVGIGNGFITSMGAVYVAEIAIDKRERGRGVLALYSIADAGTAFAYWVNFAMGFASSQAVWRFPVGFQPFFCILTLIFFWALPDTPRWYYAVGRETDGDAVLARLHDKPVTDARVLHDKAEIMASLELERSEQIGLRVKDFFWDTSETQAARRIRTAMIVFALAYLEGINMIFYYTTTIFEIYIGFDHLTASGLAGAATTVLFIFTTNSVFWIEKIGRRTWLMWGAGLQSLFMAALCALLAHPSKKAGDAAAAMLFLFIAVIASTWAPFSAVYSSEIVPLNYRNRGYSLAISCQWIFSWLTVYAGPIGAANVGWKIFLWFLCFNIIAVPFVYFCCPETRGKTLEEVDLLFVSKNLRESAAGRILQQEMVSEKGQGIADLEHMGETIETKTPMN